jgi:multidrug efflux pump subunit AcrB
LRPAGTIRLDDLGTVRDAVAEPRSFARSGDDPIVAFSISRAKGASDVSVARDVAAKVAEIEAANPGFDLTLRDSPVDHTVGNYHATMSTLLEGAVLAVIVVFIFLRDLRATIVAAIALPLSIIPAFWVMDMFGFSLNLVSLLAITLSTGILVDDAIVEIENIIRTCGWGSRPTRRRSRPPTRSASRSSPSRRPIIAVFVPSSFMGGIAGQFFKQFGITIAVAVFVSLMVARLITPMLSAYFLKSKPHPRGARGPAAPCLHPPGRLVGAPPHHHRCWPGSCSSQPRSAARSCCRPRCCRPRTPAAPCSSSTCRPGSSLDDTRAKTDAITRALRGVPEVRSVLVEGGRVPIGAPETRRATVIINYVARGERKDTQHRARSAGSPARSPTFPTSAPISSTRTGFARSRSSSPAPTARPSRPRPPRSAGQIADLRILANVVSSAALERPEILVVPRANAAAALGCRPRRWRSRSGWRRSAMSGRTSPASTPAIGQIPVRVQLAESALKDRRALETCACRRFAEHRCRSVLSRHRTRPGPGPHRALRSRAQRHDRGRPRRRHGAR